MARIDYTHLFLAVPELMIDDEVIRFLRRKGFIDTDALEFLTTFQKDKARVQRIINRSKGRTVFSRILGIAPEAISEDTINLLRSRDLISIKQGHELRIAIRTMGVLGKGTPKDLKDIVRRGRRLLGIGFSEDAIALARGADFLTVAQANALRTAVLAGDLGADTAVKLLHVKTLTDLLLLSGNRLVDKRTLQILKNTGLINVPTANALLEALNYGQALWTVWDGAKRADGLAGRMAYVVSGSFSHEAISFLTALNIIGKRETELLRVAVIVSQSYNRALMEQYTVRRYRPTAGEKPIKTFARASKYSEGQLLRLLAESAEEIRLKAKKTKGLRGKQLALQTRSLHESMRAVWEGTGYLTIFGEKQAANAALEAAEDLSKAFKGTNSPYVRAMLQFQARAGIDSFISRQENTIALSKRVYKNLDLWNGKVDQRINMSLLQGKSADELANDIRKFISPSVPGGVSYAARRLARTEIANAFHATTIRNHREQPWIRGEKWNLSSSHGKPDICNDYATKDHDGLGPGIFKKVNVPGKPHPQCLCYLTAEEMSEASFVKAMNAGRFDYYFKRAVQNDDAQQSFRTIVVEQGIRIAGVAATQVGITEGLRIVDGIKSQRSA